MNSVKAYILTRIRVKTLSCILVFININCTKCDYRCRPFICISFVKTTGLKSSDKAHVLIHTGYNASSCTQIYTNFNNLDVIFYCSLCILCCRQMLYVVLIYIIVYTLLLYNGR